MTNIARILITVTFLVTGADVLLEQYDQSRSASSYDQGMYKWRKEDPIGSAWTILANIFKANIRTFAFTSCDYLTSFNPTACL